MNSKQIVYGWLIGFVLVGCTSTRVMSDEDRANVARVRVTKNAEMARGCAFVGTVSDDSIQDLQWKASQLGGNVAVVTMQTPHGLRTSSTADVFRCEAR
jgi:hypothetical protein